MIALIVNCELTFFDVEMIIVKTSTPNEYVKQLSDYFFMDNCYALVTDVNEMNSDDVLDSIFDSFGCRIVNGKMTTLYPLMILTNSDEVVEFFSETFECNVATNPSFVDLIRTGFLPIDRRPVEEFIDYFQLSDAGDYDIIIRLFQALGYVDVAHNICMPTVKLTESIADIQPQVATSFNVLLNNVDTYNFTSTDISQVNKSVFESLKLINGKLFAIVDEIVNGC